MTDAGEIVARAIADAAPARLECEFLPIDPPILAQAALAAYHEWLEANGLAIADKAQIANLAQQIESLAYENGTLKAIVQGWHYLAVGPDEMGDYYTHKQLVKASEPYASPALKNILRPSSTAPTPRQSPPDRLG